MPSLRTDSWAMQEPEIMELTGRVDSLSSTEVEEDILLCIRSGARDMILDCNQVTYISGIGMQSLLRVAREMHNAHGHIAVCNLQPQVREMFDLCGLEQAIQVFDTTSAAREALAA